MIEIVWANLRERYDQQWIEKVNKVSISENIFAIVFL